jgi:hypothetical protein
MDHDQYTEFFCPPLWRQRRIFIQETLARFNIQTVMYNHEKKKGEFIITRFNRYWIMDVEKQQYYPT